MPEFEEREGEQWKEKGEEGERRKILHIMGSLTKRSLSGDWLSSLSLTSACFSLIKSNDCSCSVDV